MAFKAITIDSNMVYRQGFDLEHGLLAQLRQISADEIRFVVSEVVLKEIGKGLVERHRTVRDRLRNALKDGIQQGLTTGEQGGPAQLVLGGLADPVESAQARLDAFLNASGAEIVSVANVDPSDLIRLYFGSEPPFEASGNKKAEFPDAFALLSLQAWAESEGVELLVASADGGWAAYAEGVDELTIVDDLAKALSLLRDQAEAPAKAIRLLLSRIVEGAEPQLAERLHSRITAAVEALEIEPVGDSYFHFDAQLEGVRLISYDLLKNENGEFDPTIVRVDNEDAVFQIEVSITVGVEASFALRKWDGIDREYIRMGSTRSTKSVLFIGGLLVHLIGNYEDESPEWDVDEVDLVDAMDSVDFGEIEPDRDWPDDYD